jgi:hypothetical protein
LDNGTYSEPIAEVDGGNWDRPRFERWLGVPRENQEALPPTASEAPASFSSPWSRQRRGTRLERFLGVAPTEDIIGPTATTTTPPFARDAQRADVRIGASKYAVPAAVVLTVGILGLGAWTFQLRGQVSSLKKTVAAESTAGAAVTRQLTEAKAEIDRIGARLDEVERLDPEVRAIDSRLADIERRLGRRK